MLKDICIIVFKYVYLKNLFLDKLLKELKEAEKRQKQLEKKDKKVYIF